MPAKQLSSEPAEQMQVELLLVDSDEWTMENRLDILAQLFAECIAKGDDHG